MGWEELIESLEDLETKDAYDGYFCSVKDTVVIIILGSLCDLQNVKKIHDWATTEHVRAFLEIEFRSKRIPCYWWLLSLIALVTPASPNLCMKNWVRRIAPGLVEKIEAEEEKSKKKTQLTVAIDGKEISAFSANCSCVKCNSFLNIRMLFERVFLKSIVPSLSVSKSSDISKLYVNIIC